MEHQTCGEVTFAAYRQPPRRERFLDEMNRRAPQAQSVIQTKAHRHRPLSETERARNRTQSKVRAKVEQAFLVIKRTLGWANVRYRGLAKNTNWLVVAGGLANLYVARRRRLAMALRTWV
jgi:IS5 family transposase